MYRTHVYVYAVHPGTGEMVPGPQLRGALQGGVTAAGGLPVLSVSSPHQEKILKVGVLFFFLIKNYSKIKKFKFFFGE